jgi:hypothetical protein
MSLPHELTDAVASYAALHALPADLDADGACWWPTAQGLALSLRYDDAAGDAVLSITLASWPPAGDDERLEQVLRELLEANLWGIGSRGGVFAIDGAADQLVLYRRMAAARLDAATFADAVEQLFATAHEFVETLQIATLD